MKHTVTWQDGINAINSLVKKGVLGKELCPEPDYWHWHVLQIDEIPVWLKPYYHEHCNEIRW